MDSNLHEVLMPVAIMGSFGGALYFFTKVMTEYILKKKMIDKGFVNAESQFILHKEEATDNKYGALKWGLIIFFAGISLVLMEYIPARGDSPLPYGLFAVSVSLGFLIYYFLVKRNNK